MRKKSIGPKFSRLNPLVANIYVRLEPFDELEKDDAYKIEIILVMDSRKYDDPVQLKQCDKIKKQLEYQLGECVGIEVTDINIESTATITFLGLEGFREWDYSYLSFRKPDEAEMPVENSLP